jgi:hypothetical protein
LWLCAVSTKTNLYSGLLAFPEGLRGTVREVSVLSQEGEESIRLGLFRISALPRWDSMVWKWVPTKQKKASSHFLVKQRKRKDA